MRESFYLSKSEEWTNPIVLKVGGRLDAKSAARLVDACQDVKSQGKNLVLNLSGVTFVASSGMGGILAMVADFKNEGLELFLSELSPAVEAVIKLLNLDHFLSIYANQDTATMALEV